ncbi:hypothetical protein M5K25_010975 [Dendrobium thyrsiflorum]|uniref:Uncharacterized protein n=1 Tax=Dendrobium thyrsiflorum TaxID=117978 RepID=A0ABD0V8X1_DENTH
MSESQFKQVLNIEWDKITEAYKFLDEQWANIKGNTPVAVQLGHGASIQLTNIVINTGSSGSTIQFGGLEFFTATTRAAVVPMNSMNSDRPARRPHSAGTATHLVHLPTQRSTTEAIIRRADLLASQAANVAKSPHKRNSMFERLSQPEVSATPGERISVVTTNATTLPNKLVVLGNIMLKLPHMKES